VESSNPTRAWLRPLRTGAVVALASFLACAPLKVDTRSLFASVTYPNGSSSPPTPTPDELNLQVFANIELEALMAYREPAKMAGCLRTLTAPAIETLGERLAKAGAEWGAVASTMELTNECKATGEPLALVQFIVARIATTATYMATSVSITDKDRRDDVYSRVPVVLNAIANILLNTSPRGHDAEDAPALALSGGAANGAFSAGFMFELLSLRERALPPEGDNGKYRFSSIVGTSVGALMAQILDLYFVDPRLPIASKTQRELIDTCKDYWNPSKRVHTCYAVGGVDTATSNRTDCFDGWPPNAVGGDDDPGLSGLDATTRDDLFARHPRQMCALTKLYQSFTDDDEQNLMCVEPGPITRLVGLLGSPDQNLMRFDPMSSNVVAPVLDAFSDEMIANDVTRVVVSVEMQDNQTVGLDERTCRPLPSKPTQGAIQEAVGGREYCLDSAVMASAVLPVFARGIRHTYDGVTANGFCGTWFDGGLRSGFPAYRALRMTRPAMAGFVENDSLPLRVLAVGTGPLEGLPESRPSDVLDVTLDAIGQMSNQNELGEIVSAQQMALIREDQIRDIMHKPRQHAEVAALGAINDDAIVSAVYVPAETPPYLVAGSDYSFDRTLMRGLWVWGRHVALARVLGEGGLPGTRKLFERLGWSDLEPKAIAFANADTQTMKPWLDAFRIQNECSDHRQARMAAGQNRIKGCVPDCTPITSGGATFPQFFVCPAGASGR
jgi:predicted acylesterase/phospholipase RssA